MIYASQLLHKTIYKDGKKYGKLLDIAVFENRSMPPVSKFEVLHNGKKMTIPTNALSFQHNRLTLTDEQLPTFPYDHQDFYLGEDLLDKQVIDVDGKRMVRVNDVAIEFMNNEMCVIGIDVGVRGLLRRLGLGHINAPEKILPWTLVEAFDYETGSIKIKLAQKNLASLHPADIADILEEVGSKERVGIITALDAKQAARAIEESNEETQTSILEALPISPLNEIVNKMQTSEIADIFHELNPLRKSEVQKALGIEKSQKIKKVLAFSDDVAGGLMRLSFFAVKKETVIKDLVKQLSKRPSIPECILIITEEEKFIGLLYTKDLLRTDSLSVVQDAIGDRKYVYPETDLSDILELFAQYNLRVLPVVDREKKPIGIITIDDLIREIEEDEFQRYESH